MTIRYLGALLGFGFAAVWITKGFGWALLSLAVAGVGYVAGIVAEGTRDPADVGREIQARVQGMLGQTQERPLAVNTKKSPRVAAPRRPSPGRSTPLK